MFSWFGIEYHRPSRSVLRGVFVSSTGIVVVLPPPTIIMSTGKRLAKRSIIGTRVCAPGEDGKYYSGVIDAVKTPASFPENNNCINLTPNTRYSVRFDPRQGNLGRTTAEFREADLIGPGFRSVIGIELVSGQKCFVTYNGREVTGKVITHNVETDEVIIRICPPGIDVSGYF